MTRRFGGVPLRSFPVLRILLVRYGIALVAAFAVSSVAVTAVNWRLDAKVAGIDRVDVVLDDTERTAEAGNYLVVGSDSREFANGDAEAAEAFGTNGGQRSDTIMIAHVEPDEKRVLVVSIPRDTVVTAPDGGESKITDVFNDGPQALIDAITDNFGVPINHYVNIDFAGFGELVDLVGPVTVHFNAAARDEQTGLDVPKSGCIPLDGEAALAYVRSRHYEENVYGEWIEDPTSDFGRIRRQQAFLRQLATLARDKVYSSPLDVPGIADAALDTLQADEAFGRDQILGFVAAFRDVDVYDPSAVEMITLPVIAGADGTELGSIQVLDEPAAGEVLARLRVFGPDASTTTDPTGTPDAPAGGTTPTTTTGSTTTSVPLPDERRTPEGTPVAICGDE